MRDLLTYTTVIPHHSRQLTCDSYCCGLTRDPEDSVATTMGNDLTILQNDIKKLRSEKEELKDTIAKLTHEKNLVSFKNQLLVEMVIPHH